MFLTLNQDFSIDFQPERFYERRQANILKLKKGGQKKGLIFPALFYRFIESIDLSQCDSDSNAIACL